MNHRDGSSVAAQAYTHIRSRLFRGDFPAGMQLVTRHIAQELGASLLDQASAGIVYPSVRRAGGTNLACFRPVMVTNVRLDMTYRLTWDGASDPVVGVETPDLRFA